MKKGLAQIYRENRQGMFTLSLAITGCRELAEDAVQEAFARLWRNGSRPAGDPVAYAFAAVRNAAVDQVRRRGAAVRRTVPIESIFVSGTQDPAGAAACAERVETVRRALEALPPEQREVVVMKTYAGLTFSQIAETLGQPLPTVAARYRRTLERLKQSLGDAL